MHLGKNPVVRVVAVVVAVAVVARVDAVVVVASKPQIDCVK